MDKIKNEDKTFVNFIEERLPVENTLTTDRQACFQFKASFSPCTIFQILRYDLEAIEQQLTELIARAPNLFHGAPVVIDLEKVKTLGAMNFTKLKALLAANNLIPVGARCGSEEQHEEAAASGLPLMNIGKSVIDINAPAKTQEPITKTKLISQPIRSGMQVYAKDGDLIITGQVSPGAEIMADGYIHVYGPLRGRALAGVQGNTEARIFCRHLEAELVSIAGYYLTKEEMQAFPKYDGVIQIYLEGEQVRIEAV